MTAPHILQYESEEFWIRCRFCSKPLAADWILGKDAGRYCSSLCALAARDSARRARA